MSILAALLRSSSVKTFNVPIRSEVNSSSSAPRPAEYMISRRLKQCQVFVSELSGDAVSCRKVIKFKGLCCGIGLLQSLYAHEHQKAESLNHECFLTCSQTVRQCLRRKCLSGPTSGIY